MRPFNLSEWAITNRSVVVYLMVVSLAAGISAFTIVFAIGQIVGPTLVGYIADSAGGLTQGLLLSAITLWVGALLAWQQKALLYR